jgi:hypothetical protein
MSATFSDRAFELQQQGVDPDDIAQHLEQEGASPGLARICVQDLDWGSDEQTAHDDSGTAMLWLVGGLALTAVTFLLAANGGKFIIAVGPIAYGLSRLLKR